MKNCPNCKKDYKYKHINQICCSRECSSNLRKKHLWNEFCPICGAKTKKNANFCGVAHASKFKRDAYVADWINGIASGSDANGCLKKMCRDYLLELAGHKCECGWDKKNPVTKTVILTIDHKDGNWKNNALDNLKVMCYNCHSLTPTFGSLNMGNISGRRPNAQNR